MFQIVIFYVLSLILNESNTDIPKSQCMYYLFLGTTLLWFLNSLKKSFIQNLCEFLVTECVALCVFLQLRYDPNLAYAMSLYGTIVCFTQCFNHSRFLNFIIFVGGSIWYVKTCTCQVQPYTQLTAICFIETMLFIHKILLHVVNEL